MPEQHTPCKKIRIVVADSQPKVRFALRVMLARRPEIRVVGEAVDRDELLALASHMHPDLILLSWGAPGLADKDLLESVAQAAPDTSLIVLSENPGLGPAAMAAGAQAFVYKGNPPEELLSALDHCLANRKS